MIKLSKPEEKEKEFTEGCRVKCGEVVHKIFPPCDDGLALPVPYEHHICFLPPHL